MDAPIKIGLVGLGRAGMGMHLSEYRPRLDKFNIYAVCDLIGERSDKASAEFGSKIYATIDELIADPEVEIVDIATRSCDHYAHAKKALLAGKSVMLEKPFAQTYAQACELAALGSQPSGPKLFIRHNRRFEYGFEQASEIIDSGILGDVYEIKLTRNGYDRRCDWQTIHEFGGGQLLNWGPHIIDHSLRFCGGGYTSMYSDIKHVAAAGDCEDHIKIVFTGINGRIVDMEISGGVALPTPEYLIYGSKGAMVSEGGRFKLRYLDPNVELSKVVSNPGTPMGGFGNGEKLPWIEEYVDIKGDGTTRIWDALYESYRHGKAFPVKLEQATEVIRVIEQVKSNSIFN